MSVKRIAAICLGLCVAAGGARAALITQSSSIVFSSFGQVRGTYFNPTLGTLNEVDFEYSGTATGPGGVPTSVPAGATSFSYDPELGITTSSIKTFDLGPQIVPIVYTPGGGRHVQPTTLNFDVHGTLGPNSYFIASSGPDAALPYPLFDLPYIDSTVAHSYPFMPDVFQGGGTFTLIYDYTPYDVPEPASIGIFLAGLTVMFLRRRGVDSVS